MLTGSLHKFLAQLVETANSIQGRTVLYIPEEDVEDPEASSIHASAPYTATVRPCGVVQHAAKDKDLVQRLDYVLIQWTRQIKEVLLNCAAVLRGYLTQTAR